jgi:hypothetical protein
MKKLCYLLSLAGHALLLLVIIYARFPITIRPGPPRVVVVRIAEPPLPPIPEGALEATPTDMTSLPAAEKITGAKAVEGPDRGAISSLSSFPGARSLPAAGAFHLRDSLAGSFRLAPVGSSPEPWALPLGGAAPERGLRSLPGTYRPGGPMGGGKGLGVFLLPFDIREKSVADWVGSAMTRIERNWTIPVLARVAYSGWVRIGLTIEKSGRCLALTMEETTLPDSLARSALDAVQASLPLPPLPANVAGDAFAFVFVFDYNE